MDLFSIWHWLIVGAVVLLLFGGRGKVSELMGDLGKGIKAFKTGIAETSQESAAGGTSSPRRDLTDADQHGEQSSRTDAYKAPIQTEHGPGAAAGP